MNGFYKPTTFFPIARQKYCRLLEWMEFLLHLFQLHSTKGHESCSTQMKSFLSMYQSSQSHFVFFVVNDPVTYGQSLRRGVSEWRKKEASPPLVWNTLVEGFILTPSSGKNCCQFLETTLLLLLLPVLNNLIESHANVQRYSHY